ncbi:MAG: hypothetical protein R6V03_10640 [Kiritimatiellia bacterium]
MNALFRKKKSPVKKRLKRLEKELSDVQGNIHSLNRQLADGGSLVPDSKPDPYRTSAPRPSKAGREKNRGRDSFAENSGKPEIRGPDSGPSPEGPARTGGKDAREVLHDDRFLSYLMSTDFQPGGRPLRHERQIQRNKAIIMSIFVLIVVLWVLFRFVL